jgi:PhnB protein
MNQVKKIPDGYHSITPYLNVKNGSQAIEFYKKAFEAKELMRMMTPDGKAIAHATLKIGDSAFMLADEIAEMKNLSPTTLGGSSSGIFLYVEDVDKTFNNAVAEGAKILDPVEDQFWGDRHGSIEDPFGHTWSISTHIRDLSPEEMKKAADEAMKKMIENKTN